MKLLLTGGNGFIGKNILESPLTKKYNILTPSRLELDLTDEKATENFFTANNIDVVIHAAGKPGHRNAKDPSSIFYADMRMFLNLLRNAERFGKMIVIGSGAIYDQRFDIKKVKEDEYKRSLPVDEHALFRRVAADYIEKSDKIVELRIFGIFGPYEDYAIRFISNTICKSLLGLPISIKQNRRFDYIYVDDLIPVLDYFIYNQARYKAYNITPEKTWELVELAQKVLKITGNRLPVQITKEGMGLEYSGDNSRLWGELPSFSPVPIEKSILKLYKWYLNSRNLIRKEYLLEDK